ncbi:MAG: hypothetical protein GX366_05350 [Epulopiscium sp.]|nr:hypothetical protein [Candidatus Epulonipiscium sp.]
MYNGKIYEAKWWTSATPGTDQSWQEATVIIEPGDDDGQFKVVGYYPSWEPNKIDTIQYDNLTHIVYAFAIPKSDGTLRPLENPETAKAIIREGNKNNVKVMLAIGGWSYNDVPLEPTFLAATDSPAKIKKFGDEIVAMAKEYGFHGVDMDWEHPRADGTSKQQYEDLMLYLKDELKKEDMLFSSAVLSGVTSDGNILYDAQGHTNTVLNCVDWINVMAYDGGDGDRHSSYEFAVNSANYWKNTRGVPASKIVLGVPFYGRPTWSTYEQILAVNPNAHTTDISIVEGKEVHYNGIPTIEKKTQWACDNVGGTMMWELSQDSTDPDKSLLNAMGKVVRKNNK